METMEDLMKALTLSKPQISNHRSLSVPQIDISYDRFHFIFLFVPCRLKLNTNISNSTIPPGAQVHIEQNHTHLDVSSSTIPPDTQAHIEQNDTHADPIETYFQVKNATVDWLQERSLKMNDDGLSIYIGSNGVVQGEKCIPLPEPTQLFSKLIEAGLMYRLGQLLDDESELLRIKDDLLERFLQSLESVSSLINFTKCRAMAPAPPISHPPNTYKHNIPQVATAWNARTASPASFWEDFFQDWKTFNQNRLHGFDREQGRL
jgi:hypothetical protein